MGARKSLLVSSRVWKTTNAILLSPLVLHRPVCVPLLVARGAGVGGCRTSPKFLPSAVSWIPTFFLYSDIFVPLPLTGFITNWFQIFISNPRNSFFNNSCLVLSGLVPGGGPSVKFIKFRAYTFITV